MLTRTLLYGRRLKDGLLELGRSVPLAWDAYLYFWRFYRETNACRGAFGDFASARRTCRSDAPLGFSQAVIAETDSDSVAQLTARRDSEQLHPLDYPVLFWLQQVLTPKSCVFNLGGNVGTEFYAFRSKLPLLDQIRWAVCEVPEIARAGEKLASRRGVKNLSFTTRFEEADGCDIFLTCGALQYLEEDLSVLLRKLRQRPRHVLVHRVPMYDGAPFVTLQNLGFAFAPYCVRNAGEFIEGMKALGYRHVDGWRDRRINEIPFRPELTVRGYRGFYFSLSEHNQPNNKEHL